MDRDYLYNCPPELIEQRKKLEDIIGPYTDKRVLDCLHPWDKWENIDKQRKGEIIKTVWNIYKWNYWFDANTNVMKIDIWGYIIDAIEEALELEELKEINSLTDLVDDFCQRNKDKIESFYNQYDRFFNQYISFDKNFEWNFRKKERERIIEAYLKNPSKCNKCKVVLPFIWEQISTFIKCPFCSETIFYSVEL